MSKTIARYRNPWHKPGRLWGTGEEFFQTDVRPHKYRGYLIYHRGGGYDVVAKMEEFPDRNEERGTRNGHDL